MNLDFTILSEQVWISPGHHHIPAYQGTLQFLFISEVNRVQFENSTTPTKNVLFLKKEGFSEAKMSHRVSVACQFTKVASEKH